MTIITQSEFDPHTRILTTRLRGTVTGEDVDRWQQSLAAALAQVEDNHTFKLLVDLHGYEPGDLAAHKAMRTVIPTTVAAYGLRSALLDLFPDAEIALTHTRGITCTALANVHHDADKMAEYAALLDRERQRFFTDPAAARAWLLALPE